MTSVLVLWDVDHTLINAGGGGIKVYEYALQELFGLPLPTIPVPMAGRTDRAIAVDVLTAAGISDPRDHVDAFQAKQASYAAEVAPLFRAKGRVLPGAREAIAAIAAGRPGLEIVQSLLTGNLQVLAEVKLSSLGLTEHLDLAAGAYGTESEVRADLVPIARRNAAARYGDDFADAATVLIGDTPLDIEAALTAGARAVGVATGLFTQDQLADAGADAVLADLTDTEAAVSAILGPVTP